jgi:hypothetical protein
MGMVREDSVGVSVFCVLETVLYFTWPLYKRSYGLG